MLQQKKYMTLTPAPQSVTGLALSGGGLRAIGHIGVLKALEQHGIRASVLSGTSAGAVVGAFYAAGFTPDDMFTIIHKTDFFPKSYLRLRTNGLFSATFLVKLFSQFLPADFSGLKLPLWVAATELTAGVTEFFHEGDLYEALLASSSIPFVLPAVHDGNKMYMDGGILNNLPIEPLRDKCDYLIGVHVNAISHELPVGVRQTFDRVFHLALSNAVYAK
ncbi:MAG: patatin-like phospholipase family protein, partial [Pseudobacter sp.]|uniref:patatin-like phospholipase family protein n=1 Tax=Pseudobacter sp. TaxID=2045420 RepID=UPI003F82319E